MTKQRLAEIMQEISEGAETLKDTAVLMAVTELSGEKSKFGLVGSATSRTAERMAISILRATWQKEFNDTPFEKYLFAISAWHSALYEAGFVEESEL